jgi:uncharacterized protein (DUF433 family)
MGGNMMNHYIADRITVNPEQCGGRPCIRGMRIRAVDVLELLAAGLSFAELLAELPDLELADVFAALKFATRQVDHPVLASV